MYVRATLVVLATMIGLAGSANADVFASGPAYGGPGSVGGTVNCRIFNFGAYGVTVTAREIFNNTGASVALTSDTCNVALAPTKSCAYTASIVGNLAFSCKATVIGIDPKISGVTEIQNSSHSVLTTVPLSR
jgi:hypothetical protein